MNDFKLKVLLCSAGLGQDFSAAIYAARLLQNSPDMNLTILQIQDQIGNPPGVKYSWVELRYKYERDYSVCSSGTDYNWLATWPVSLESKWLKQVYGELNPDNKKRYQEILTKTDRIFSAKKQSVTYEILCINKGYSETSDKSEKAKSIVDYATKNLYDLIIIGSRRFSILNQTVFGSLAQEVLKKSKIPVLLINKLPRNFVDSYLAECGA